MILIVKNDNGQEVFKDVHRAGYKTHTESVIRFCEQTGSPKPLPEINIFYGEPYPAILRFRDETSCMEAFRKIKSGIKDDKETTVYAPVIF